MLPAFSEIFCSLYSSFLRVHCRTNYRMTSFPSFWILVSQVEWSTTLRITAHQKTKHIIIFFWLQKYIFPKVFFNAKEEINSSFRRNNTFRLHCCCNTDLPIIFRKLTQPANGQMLESSPEFQTTKK